MRYGVNTNLSPPDAIKAAIDFFGPSGVGLKIEDQGDDCVTFTGSGGHVAVSACEHEDPSATGSEVELETREWDYDVKRFINKI